MRTGHCHCKNVRFGLTGEPIEASLCHCAICRRLTGTAFAAWCEVSDRDFQWLAGQAGLASYRATDRLEIRFCATCGTTVLATRTDWPGFCYIPLGALDDNAGIVPEYHQFSASGAPWYPICAVLPKYQTWPEEPDRSCGWGAVEATHARGVGAGTRP